MGEEPGCSQIALLPQIGPEHAHIEVLRFYSPQIMIESTESRVDGNRLVIIRRSSRRDRAGVGTVLPEEGTHAAPIAEGQPLRVASEQMLNALLVAPTAGGGAVFDAASTKRQDADPNRKESLAAQATSSPSRDLWPWRNAGRRRSSSPRSTKRSHNQGAGSGT